MSSSPAPAASVAPVEDIPVVGEPASHPVIGEPQADVVLGEPVNIPNGVPEVEPPIPAAPPAFESNGIDGHSHGSPTPPAETPSASEHAAATEASSEVSPTDNLPTTEAPSATDRTSEIKAEASSKSEPLVVREEETADETKAEVISEAPVTKTEVTSEALETAETKNVDVDALETKADDAEPETETVTPAEAPAVDASPGKEQISEIFIPKAVVDEAPITDDSSDTKAVAVSEASNIEDDFSAKASTGKEHSGSITEDRSVDINSLAEELKSEVKNEIPPATKEVDKYVSEEAKPVVHETEAVQTVNQEAHAVDQNVNVSANGESVCQCAHEDGGDAEREQDLPNGQFAEKEKKSYLQFMKVPLVVTGLAIAAAGVALASLSRPH